MTQATSGSEFDFNQFSSQTEELHRLLEKFSEILDQESVAIRSNQIEELSSVLSSKQAIAEDLNQTSDSLEKLLSQFSLNIVTFSESDFFNEMSKAEQQKTLLNIQLIQTCHDKNLANGMAIQTLNNINQHALDLITGKNVEDVKLYSSSGEKTGAERKSITLGKA